MAGENGPGATLAVITLCKDDAPGLARTLASTRKLREYSSVVQRVVDGSSAELCATVRDLVEAERGVTYEWQPPNGTACAFNQALPALDEPWVWFLNSGDEVLEDFSIPMLFEILQKSSAKVVTFSIRDHDGAISRRPSLPFLWPPVFTWLCFPATVFRVEELVAIGGFDLNFRTSGDGEMWFRLLNRRSVSLDIVSVPMVKMDPAGLSGNRTAVAKEALEFLRKHRFMIFKRWVQSGLRYFEAKRKYRRRLSK